MTDVDETQNIVSPPIVVHPEIGIEEMESALRPDFEAALRAQVERVEREGDRGKPLDEVVDELGLDEDSPDNFKWWNYCIVKRYVPLPLVPDSPLGWCYGIHEVYYKADGTVESWTIDSVGPFGNTAEELREVYDMMAEAFVRPVLDEKELLEVKKQEQEIDIESKISEYESEFSITSEQFKRLRDMGLITDSWEANDWAMLLRMRDKS